MSLKSDIKEFGWHPNFVFFKRSLALLAAGGFFFPPSYFYTVWSVCLRLRNCLLFSLSPQGRKSGGLHRPVSSCCLLQARQRGMVLCPWGSLLPGLSLALLHLIMERMDGEIRCLLMLIFLFSLCWELNPELCPMLGKHSTTEQQPCPYSPVFWWPEIYLFRPLKWLS